MNKSDLEEIQKYQEEYDKFLKESPLHSETEKMAEDIIKKQDITMAMEFTRTIAELLRENGITVHCERNEFVESCSDKSIKQVYQVKFDSINSTEHDKKFTKKIAELEEECNQNKNEICHLKEINARLKKNADTYVNYILPRATKEAKEAIDNHAYPCIRIITMEEWSRKKDKKLEDKIAEYEEQEKKCTDLEQMHQSDCITINQLHTALDVMTEKYQRLREVHGL